MIKQNFYQGQRVVAEDLNKGLRDYSEGLTNLLEADLLGAGLIQGFAAEVINGYVMGIGAGLAYNAQGQRLQLDSGVQVNLAAHAPAVGTKIVKVWALPSLIKSDPVLDSGGDTVYRRHMDSVEFGSGDIVPVNGLHLYDVQLSTGAILIINPAYPLLETPLAQSLRTRGYTYNGGNPKITAPNGFEVDLLTLATRRAVFDALKPGGCKKGDIIWLEPPTYETQTTPPAGGGISYPHTVPAGQAFMGKARTYSAQTNFRQYAVRLRALVDNPRNPNITGAIGTDWAVDDPSAIVEEGSNANGSYVITADGKVLVYGEKQHSGMVLNTLHSLEIKFPIELNILKSYHPTLLITSGENFIFGLANSIIENYYVGKTIARIYHRYIANRSDFLNKTVAFQFEGTL